MPPQWKHPRFSSRTDLQELQTQMKKAAVVKFSLCVCRPCVLSISVNDAFLFHSFSASLFCMICNGAGCVGSFTWCFTTARHHQVQQKFRRCRPKTDKTARNRYDMLVLNGIALDSMVFYPWLAKTLHQIYHGNNVMHRIRYTLCPFPEHRYRLPWRAYLFVSLRFLSRSLHQIALSNIRTGTQHESVASVWDCLLRYSGILW